MHLLNSEMFPNPLVCCNGLDPLFPALYLQLVVLPENFKKGAVFKCPRGEPGQFKIWDHGDIIEYGPLVNQAKSFHIDAAHALLLFTDFKTKGLLPTYDSWFYNYPGGKAVLTNGRSSSGEGEDADPFWLTLDNRAQSLMS